MEEEAQTSAVPLGQMFSRLVFDFGLLNYESDSKDQRNLLPAITRSRSLADGSMEFTINGTIYVLSHEYTFFSSNDLVGGYIELKSLGEVVFAVQTEHSHEKSRKYWNRVKSIDIFVPGLWIDDFLAVHQQAEQRAAADSS